MKTNIITNIQGLQFQKYMQGVTTTRQGVMTQI